MPCPALSAREIRCPQRILSLGDRAELLLCRECPRGQALMDTARARTAEEEPPPPEKGREIGPVRPMQNLEPEPLPENKPSKKEKPMQIPSKRAIARRAGINPGSLDYALKAMQAGKSTPAVVKVARVMERMGVTLEMLAGQAPPEPEAPREEEAAEAEPQEAAVPEVEPEPGPEPEVASEPEPEPEPTQEAEPDSEAEPRSEMEPCDDTLSRIEAELAAEEEGTGQTRPLSLYPWEDLAREITRRMPPGSEVTLRA